MFKRFIGLVSIMFVLTAWSLVNGLTAQTFIFENDTSTAKAAAGKTIAPKTIIINKSTDTLDFYWKRKASNIPSKWQNPGVCDKNACYNSADSATFTLAPDTSGQLKVNFYARDTALNPVEGKGSITIKVGLTGSQFPDAEEQTAYFSASTFSTGVDDGPSARELQTYPNPVDKRLNLKFQKPGSHTIRLFNVLGKAVTEKVIRNQNGFINMASLDDGIYILRVSSANGTKTTKRIYKR